MLMGTNIYGILVIDGYILILIVYGSTTAATEGTRNEQVMNIYIEVFISMATITY